MAIFCVKTDRCRGLCWLILQHCCLFLACNHPYFTSHPPGSLVSHRLSVGFQRLPTNRAARLPCAHLWCCTVQYIPSIKYVVDPYYFLFPRGILYVSAVHTNIQTHKLALQWYNAHNKTTKQPTSTMMAPSRSLPPHSTISTQ